MKKIAAKVVLSMTFVFLLTAAGYSQQPVLKADVPFDFVVGQKVFPSGQYEVIRLSPQMLTLRGNDNGFLTLFVTRPVETLFSNNPKLKFKTVGGQHVLAEIWPEGATTGYAPLSTEPAIVAQIPSAPEGQTTTATYVGK